VSGDSGNTTAKPFLTRLISLSRMPSSGRLRKSSALFTASIGTWIFSNPGPGS
jgi:hypothetical protein